jgi:putative DNA methylase
MLKCALEYPQTFATSPTKSQSDLESDEGNNPLAVAVKKWSDRIFAEAKAEMKQYYPEKEKGSIPIGYIWARTIRCQNPSCNAELPLLRQLWLARKPNMKVALFPFVHKGKVEFKVVGDGYVQTPKVLLSLSFIFRTLGRFDRQRSRVEKIG